MARKQLSRELMALKRSGTSDPRDYLSIFVLGPSNRPNTPMADEPVLQIENDSGEVYLLSMADLKKAIEES